MEAYLDNSATTKCYDEVADIVVKTMLNDYGNPSSMHRKGVEAETYITGAQEILAGILRVQPREIYFTSGGTESNNLAILGSAAANKRSGRHIITSSVEHPSASGPMKQLEEMGFRVTYLPVDEYGVIRLADLQEALCEETILVSVMYVNNEIGAVQPVQEIGALLHKEYPRVLFHVDAIQAFGKYQIYPSRMNIHMLSVSGHKIHGPKGVGFLYIRDKVKISPVILGGGHQKGLRPGTQNVPGTAGLSVAAQLAYQDLDSKTEQLYRLKEIFAAGIGQMADTVIHGPALRDSAPHIINVSFTGVRSEVLLHALEDKGIYVSAGSACSSNKQKAGSPTMQALGAPAAQSDSAIRFSFSEFTTEKEIVYTLETLETLVPMLRRYTRK